MERKQTQFIVTIDLTRSVTGGKYKKNLTDYWSQLYDKINGTTN